MHSFLRFKNSRDEVMSQKDQPALVSIHGGHSGEFCCHAKDRLEDIVKAYIKKGYSWVGITEHMPPVNDDFLYPDEKDAGLSAEIIYQRFIRYVSTCRKLQKEYSPAIEIYVGFETETYSGSEQFVRELIQEFQPDYIVGSVHHVNNISIDYSKEQYEQAVIVVGGLDELYCRYFDQQYEMINALKPAVIGHFDLIRTFDPDYRSRLKKTHIQKLISRNLERIKAFDLILDFNVRALNKGASEPYVSRSILLQALDLGIAVVPGDDSHSVETVGLNIDRGIKILQELKFDTRWRIPPTQHQ